MEVQSAATIGSSHYPAQQLLGVALHLERDSNDHLWSSMLWPLAIHIIHPQTPHPSWGCSKPPSLFLPYNLCFPPSIPFWHLLLQAHHTTSVVAAFCSTQHLLQGDVSHHKMQSTHHCSSPHSALFITFITAGNYIYTSIHPTGIYLLLSV